MARLEIDARTEHSWRDRWRRVRDLLGGALILVVWLGLWAWVAMGVGAPLSRVRVEQGSPAAAVTLDQGA